MNSRKSSHRAGAHLQRSAVAQTRGDIQSEPTVVPGQPPVNSFWLVVSGVSMLVAIAWAYWPTIGAMVHQWNHQPDYSHGFLVLPIALLFLWSRRATMPIATIRPSIWGAILLLVVCIARLGAGMYYLTPLDGWSLPIAIAGIVWLLYGWEFLRWSLPAIIFLWFMVPIPYSAESWLSVPLQSVATKLSTAALVFLGQPAIAEGHTIFLGDHQLFVEEACSGLRIFVGIFALAFAFVLFSRWCWWKKLLVLISAAPVAIVANAMRIVGTALLHELISGEVANKFMHDVAGFIMIPLAALMFLSLLVYFDKLFPEVEDIGYLSVR